MEDITPSHPDFDRSGLTDVQFIEQLMFEIQELKSTVQRKDLLIRSLQGNLNGDKQKNKVAMEAKEKETKVIKETKENEIKDTKLVEKKSEPIESKLESKLESKSIDLESKLDPKLEPKLESKLDPKLDPKYNQVEPKKEPIVEPRDTRVDSKELPLKLEPKDPKINTNSPLSIEELQVVPQRSARRKLISEENKEEVNFNKDEIQSVSPVSPVSAPVPPVVPPKETIPPVVPQKEPIVPQKELVPPQKESLPQKESSAAKEFKESLNSVTVPQENLSKEHESIESASNRSSVYSDEKIINESLSNDKTNTTIDVSESIDTTISDVEADLDEEEKSSIGKLKSPETIFQHSNPSNSSFHSYKSRIKLPPHLQHNGQVNSPPSQQQSTNSAHASPLTVNTKLDPDSLKVRSKTPPLPERFQSSQSPDDNRIKGKGFGHSKTLKDLNVHNLSISQPGNNYAANSNGSLKSPAILSHDNDIPIPRTPDGFNNNQDTLGELSSFSSPATYGHDETMKLNDYSQDSFRRKISSHSNYGNSSFSVNSIGNNNVNSIGTNYEQTNRSNYSMRNEDEESLFIKPDDFQTICINVLSTISLGNLQSQAIKKLDEVFITLSITDRNSGKEMWKIQKSYLQLQSFDNEIRPIVEYFGLPELPDKSLFFSTTPNKIDMRKTGLQNYFNTLFVMPHIPHLILFRICKYLSLDMVNPLDEFKSGAKKEGYLVRRYKGLGTNWKIRWCQVDGPMLELYDCPGGSLIESISLVNCQIGRQSNDSVAEEKGYRHAFLIMETVKSSKLSNSLPKHFFCAESDEERDDWVTILIDNTENPNLYQKANSQQQNQNYIQSQLQHQNQNQNQNQIQTNYSYQYNPDRSYEDDKSYNSIETPRTIDSKVSDRIDEDSIRSPLEEKKLNKKRSIFAFRKNTNSSNNSSSIQESNSIAEIDNIIPSSYQTNYQNNHSNHSHDDIQSYLDKMGLDEGVSKSIFGRDLVSAYNISHHVFLERSIPSIIYRCVDFLIRTGAMYEEGIFRLSGSASSIRQFKEQFNRQFDINLFELKPDIHTVAGLFKTYLRELPEPIITEKILNELRQIVVSRGGNSNTGSMSLIIRDHITKNLDKIHYDSTYIILKFLKEIINNSQANKMNLRNVCIVFVPTLNISLDILMLLLVDFPCIFENQDPVPDDKREVLDLNIPNF